jgi:uncharacterized protein with von Willebrand factor type A (vWA) domain
MRARGARVGMGEQLTAHRALAAVDAADSRQAFLAMRTALCGSRQDVDRFAAAFGECFGGAGADAPLVDPVATATLPRAAIPGPVAGPAAPPAAESVRPAAWSDIELLREKDFADYSDAERAIAREVLAQLARRRATRPGHRTRPVRRRDARLDVRATLRGSLRHSGEPIERRWRQPRSRQRPIVLVCDVSGSMEPYSRMLLAWAHACVRAQGRCEVFAFSTRLSRITRELSSRDPDAAVRAAAASADDWSGGTRIGDVIAALNRDHGRRIGRGAVVTILSDGWDLGDPEVLEREIARLSRCAHRLVWLNPLSAAEGYEPLTRGMATALPHVDVFIAGNTLDSLAQLAELTEAGLT